MGIDKNVVANTNKDEVAGATPALQKIQKKKKNSRTHKKERLKRKQERLKNQTPTKPSKKAKPTKVILARLRLTWTCLMLFSDPLHLYSIRLKL
jgi:ribosomal protein L44E